MNRVAKKELKKLNKNLRNQGEISIKKTKNGLEVSGDIIFLEKLDIIRDKKMILMFAGGIKWGHSIDRKSQSMRWKQHDIRKKYKSLTALF